MSAFVPVTVTPTVALLQSQLTRLNTALVEAADNGHLEIACMAKRYAERVSEALSKRSLHTDDVAWRYGDNGWAPAVESICRQAGRRAA